MHGVTGVGAMAVCVELSTVGTVLADEAAPTHLESTGRPAPPAPPAPAMVTRAGTAR